MTTEPALVVGTNTYASLDEADAVAASRLFNSPWNSASADTRAKALITATALLDRLQWQGRQLVPSQPLAWPRVALHCPAGYPLSTEIEPAIVTATVELAMHLIASGDYIDGPAIQTRMLGDSMVTYFAHVADELPKRVRRLIEPYLCVSSANVAEVRF